MMSRDCRHCSQTALADHRRRKKYCHQKQSSTSHRTPSTNTSAHALPNQRRFFFIRVQALCPCNCVTDFVRQSDRGAEAQRRRNNLAKTNRRSKFRGHYCVRNHLQCKPSQPGSGDRPWPRLKAVVLVASRMSRGSGGRIFRRSAAYLKMRNDYRGLQPWLR